MAILCVSQLVSGPARADDGAGKKVVVIIDRSPSLNLTWRRVVEQVRKICGVPNETVELVVFPRGHGPDEWGPSLRTIECGEFLAAANANKWSPTAAGESRIGAVLNRWEVKRRIAKASKVYLISDGRNWSRRSLYSVLQLGPNNAGPQANERVFCDTSDRTSKSEPAGVSAPWTRRQVGNCNEDIPPLSGTMRRKREYQSRYLRRDIEPAYVPSWSTYTKPGHEHREVVAVGRGGRYFCTGVLIAPSWVLTARHCLPADRILVGASIKTPEKVVAVSESEVAPAGLDVALLRLVRPLDVTPASLPAAEEDEAPNDIRFVGFGSDSRDGRRGYGTRHVREAVVDGWGCTPGRAQAAGCDPATEMLAINTGGVDTCDGDSGGPVYVPKGDGWQLAAITSRPVRWATVRCGQGGVYVRYSALASWVVHKISNGKTEAK